MLHYIRTYTSTCNICLRTKPSSQAPIGELHPPPIPKDRWSIASNAFVSDQGLQFIVEFTRELY